MSFIFHCKVCLLDSNMSFSFSRNVNFLKILIELPDVLFAVQQPRKSCFRFQQGLAEAQQPVEKNCVFLFFLKRFILPSSMYI